MTTLSEIRRQIGPELERLNDKIVQTLQSPNAMMSEIIAYYLKTKGKQIRPILVVLSAKLLGEVNEAVLSAGASVELLHNASLIHDDIVDDTKCRRGVATVNGLWDNHIAVLVGDFFVSSSLQQALLTSDLRIIDCIARLGRVLSVGELDQIACARNHTLDENAYFSNIERKTASLFVSCVCMGGYAVKASDADIERISEFARLLGLCFQIKDDIFDYFGDEKIGKPTGNDLREGKITLPLLHVLLDPALPRHEEMTALVRQEQLSADEIAALIGYAKEHGGIEYAYARMSELRQRAAAIMAGFDSPVATLLMDLFDYTIRRDI